MKFAALGLIAAIALTFSSCLGSSDSANQIVGTATITNEFSNTVTFDDGIKANITNLTSGALMNSDFKRMQLVLTVTDEAYKKGTIPAGTTVNTTYSYINPLYSMQQTDSATMKTVVATDFDNFTWASANGVPYAYGNGYMNFVFTATVITKTASGKTTLVLPRIYAAPQYNEQGNNVEVFIGFDNRAKEADANNDGKMDDGYNSTTSAMYCTLDIQSLYYDLTAKGFKDTDNINFVFYKMYPEKTGEQSSVRSESVTVPQSTVQLGALKKLY